VAGHIPFTYERSIAAHFAGAMTTDNPAVQNRLQQLADQLSSVMSLPGGMSVEVHYLDEDRVNAFATLGGHILVYRGLIEATPNENALAMVLAHEIAHVKHRDPIVALGRTAIIGTALSALAGVNGGDLAGRLLGDAGLLTSLHFNRAQESAADEEALAAVERHYGHVAGATAIFEHFLAEEHSGSLRVPEFFSTHPASRRRIDRLHEEALAHHWSEQGAITALPAGW